MSVYVSIPLHESEITICDSGKIESMSDACGHHKCNAGTCARMTQEESHHKCSVLHLQKKWSISASSGRMLAVNHGGVADHLPWPWQ